MSLWLNEVELRFLKGNEDEVEVEEDGNDDDEEGSNANKGKDSGNGLHDVPSMRALWQTLAMYDGPGGELGATSVERDSIGWEAPPTNSSNFKTWASRPKGDSPYKYESMSSQY
jgi:hypothetical protein